MTHRPTDRATTETAIDKKQQNVYQKRKSPLEANNYTLSLLHQPSRKAVYISCQKAA